MYVVGVNSLQQLSAVTPLILGSLSEKLSLSAGHPTPPRKEQQAALDSGFLK